MENMSILNRMAIQRKRRDEQKMFQFNQGNLKVSTLRLRRGFRKKDSSINVTSLCSRKRRKIYIIFSTILFFLFILMTPGEMINARADNNQVLPVSYDMRMEGRLPEVRNQGKLPWCWAYAAIGSMESNLITQGYADEKIDLSESHLVYFSSNSCKDENSPFYNQGMDVNIFSGGYLSYVEYSLSKGWGPELEENSCSKNKIMSAFWENQRGYSNLVDFGINSNDNRRYILYDESQRNAKRYQLSNCYHFSKTDIYSIKSFIQNYGGVAAEFESENNDYCNYADTTVFHYSKEKEFFSTNHCIVIVGWNDDFPATAFPNYQGPNGAWLCRNSWGSNWGDEGYFWIPYGEYSLTHFTGFIIKPINKYNHIYQYDINYGKNLSYLKSANVFKMKRKETLSSISFSSKMQKCQYSLKVYMSKNFKGNPEKGKLLFKRNGELNNTTFNTVDISKKITVEKNMKVSIVLTLFDEIDHDYYICEEDMYKDFDCNKNETYYYDKKKWKDATTTNDGNACIKLNTISLFIQ